MESSELPEGWIRVPEFHGLSAYAIYRDAEAGRQLIEFNNGRFELSCQGWEGVLALSEDLQECLDTADRFRGFRSFRIANMTQDELSEYTMQCAWMAVACLSDPTESNIQKARKAISDVETLMTALRVRCAQKDPAGWANINAKADSYAAEARFLILNLFRKLGDGDVVSGEESLAALDSLVLDMNDDLDDVRTAMLSGDDNGAN